MRNCRCRLTCATGGSTGDWPHLFSRDVLERAGLVEYPAFFAWDLAFHMIPMARNDPDFAKNQLLLLSAVSGICIPTASCRPSSMISPTSIHRFTPGPVGRYSSGPAALDHAFLERASSQIADELYLVGESQGSGRPQRLQRWFSWEWITWACSTGPDRCRPAAASSRLTAPRLDEASIAPACCELPWVGPSTIIGHARMWCKLDPLRATTVVAIQYSLSNLGWPRGLLVNDEDGLLPRQSPINWKIHSARRCGVGLD